ncbi:helix-turn-helix domain-containing protein [Dyadobacter psychrophilus]|uniref:HTH-type transcriptional regulator / antitoxin HigA n=1 Tax=Dyadobacter psychrophilus TaxID=651661 RepID=A0A1T5FRB6_9BACT|nr:transcriptional regulator [Dyadobacter psychrophilus]SKB98725.1 HTH-type transcriptional regulator / antitoxin HigA [Dyadobacter psychrophilus]
MRDLDMELKIIETEEEYNNAITRIDELFDAKKGSQDAKELDLLVLLVNKYELENFPIDEPDPIEYIKIRMEEMGLKASDLVPYMGNKGNVSRVLNRKRGLSIEMIRNLHKGLGFPLDVLVSEPKLKPA